jgi:hypothetical protein
MMAAHSHRLGAAIAATLITIGTASASQGPGTAAGTASSAVQLLMAALVYGSCGAIIAAGLIGLARRR